MDPNWNDKQPIYRQLRDRMVALILEGALKEGAPLRSVRADAPDGTEGLSAVGRRALGREAPRPGHVRERRRSAAAPGRRARTFPQRGMAADPGGHPQAGFFLAGTVRANTGAYPPGPAAPRRRRQGGMRVTMPPLIEARDLTKKYGAHVALDRANFCVESGRIVGLLGPNG